MKKLFIFILMFYLGACSPDDTPKDDNNSNTGGGNTNPEPNPAIALYDSNNTLMGSIIEWDKVRKYIIFKTPTDWITRIFYNGDFNYVPFDFITYITDRKETVVPAKKFLKKGKYIIFDGSTANIKCLDTTKKITRREVIEELERVEDFQRAAYYNLKVLKIYEKGIWMDDIYATSDIVDGGNVVNCYLGHPVLGLPFASKLKLPLHLKDKNGKDVFVAPIEQ